ncbi:cyclin N-terminal domain-containing protein 1-like [Dysidea avara]|uniref:cyclin N-terminal domain-containing protein 1-like n=1 Tax=Dysidea avara TaxID=196820 RepID=UPI0033220C13
MVSFGYKKKKQYMQRLFGGSVFMETPKRSSQQFFTSPPEPLFNDKHVGMKPALLEETLQQLAKENELNMLNMDDECKGVFKNGKRAVFMFLLCKHYKLGYEDQFVAIELFSRFMSKHVAELLQHVKETKNTENAIEWSHVEQRIKHQIMLRTVTCAQVASKVCSHYRIISLGSAKRFLASHGFRYAANSIVQSEVRILKTLNYKVHPPMPLTYVEALLEIVGHNNPSLTVKHFHGICLNVLELYYIQRDAIYARLKQIAGVTSGQKHRGNTIEKDNMLTGSAIIGAAAYILDKSSSDQIIDHLSKITEIVNDDILDFSAVLIEQVLANDEE